MTNAIIGEITHRLEDRIKEHKSACVYCDTEISALAEYTWNEGHHAAWEKITVLDNERRRFGLSSKKLCISKPTRKPHTV